MNLALTSCYRHVSSREFFQFSILPMEVFRFQTLTILPMKFGVKVALDNIANSYRQTVPTPS